MGKKDKVNAILFDRDETFEAVKCKTVAGIASYGIGGFEVNHNTVLKYSFGSSIWEVGDPTNRRASKPIFLAKVTDTAALNFKDNNNKTNEITMTPIARTDFNRRENLAAEIGRSEAARKMNSIDSIHVRLIELVLFMAIPPVFLGILLGIRELE